MKNSILIGTIIMVFTCVFLLIITSRADVFGDNDAAGFFKSLGYEIKVPAQEIKQIRFPEQMNDIYEDYNRLQKQAGYDISPYLGKTVTRRTYTITNYTDSEQINIIGNLFIYNNKIIGGDITNVAINGFMHPLIARGD